MIDEPADTAVVSDATTSSINEIASAPHRLAGGTMIRVPVDAAERREPGNVGPRPSELLRGRRLFLRGCRDVESCVRMR